MSDVHTSFGDFAIISFIWTIAVSTSFSMSLITLFIFTLSYIHAYISTMAYVLMFCTRKKHNHFRMFI